MDREIPKSQVNRQKLGQIFRWLIAITILIGAFLLVRKLFTTKIEKGEFRLATVENGAVSNTISATGLVLPSFEQQINSPINTEIKKVHLTNGATIDEGDLILDLDQSSIRLSYDQLKDELEVRKNNVTRLKLEYDKNVRDLELDDQILALRLSSLEAQLADMKRLKEVGGATDEEVEKAELDLQISQLEKRKLENDLSFRKESLTSEKRNLELEVEIQEKRLKEIGSRLNKTSVRSPGYGVITWVNEDLGIQVNEGDPLVRIADLSSFKVEATVSDRYLQRLKEGSLVELRINRDKLMGVIYAILPAVENNSVKFQIQLDDPKHESLRPNMRVEVFVLTDQKAETIRVLNGPVFSGAKVEDVFVVQGDKAVKRKVTIGIRSNDYTEILSGLSPGDEIIVSDMTEYEHLDEVILKP